MRPRHLVSLGAGILAALLGVGWMGADTLEISATPPQAVPATIITFTFTPKIAVQGDSLTFDFGDGAHIVVAYDWTCGLLAGCGQTTHTYSVPGTFTVSATGKISGQAVSGGTQVVILAVPAPSETFVATAAHSPGYNNTTWRTDLDVHNPTDEEVTYSVALLPAGADNSHPVVFEFKLLGGRSDSYQDVLATVFSFSGAAALRVASASPDLLVSSRTYDQLSKGSFGQYVPGLGRSRAVHSGQEGRLIGLSHDRTLVSGFRTNLGLLSLSSAPITVEVAFYSRFGSRWGTKSYELKPFEFRQINKAFEEVTLDQVSSGYVTLQTVNDGGTFLAYASVIDNVTGDPVFVPVSVLDRPTTP
jgi:hypothetical protein